MSNPLLDQLVKLQNLALEFKVIQKELNFLSYETDQHRQEMENVLKTHQSDMGSLCVQINNPSLLSQIAKLQGKYHGIFLAPVIDSVCIGCRMRVPAGLMVKLNKGESIVYCENCGRILRRVDHHPFITQPTEPAPPKRGRKPKNPPRL